VFYFQRLGNNSKTLRKVLKRLMTVTGYFIQWQIKNNKNGENDKNKTKSQILHEEISSLQPQCQISVHLH